MVSLCPSTTASSMTRMFSLFAGNMLSFVSHVIVCVTGHRACYLFSLVAARMLSFVSVVTARVRVTCWRWLLAICHGSCHMSSFMSHGVIRVYNVRSWNRSVAIRGGEDLRGALDHHCDFLPNVAVGNHRCACTEAANPDCNNGDSRCSRSSLHSWRGTKPVSNNGDSRYS